MSLKANDSCHFSSVQSSSPPSPHCCLQCYSASPILPVGLFRAVAPHLSLQQDNSCVSVMILLSGNETSNLSLTKCDTSSCFFVSLLSQVALCISLKDNDSIPPLIVVSPSQQSFSTCLQGLNGLQTFLVLHSCSVPTYASLDCYSRLSHALELLPLIVTPCHGLTLNNSRLNLLILLPSHPASSVCLE